MRGTRTHFYKIRALDTVVPSYLASILYHNTKYTSSYKVYYVLYAYTYTYTLCVLHSYKGR